METIRKSIGEGFGKGEIYAALAYDPNDKYGGLAQKQVRYNPESGKTAVIIGDSTTAVTLATYAQRAISIYTTCASTDGSNVVLPVYINATMSGQGGLGRALEAKLTVTGKLGSYGNALKGYVDLTGGTGSVGLISAICAEMKMSASATLGTFGVLEIELVCPASWTAGQGTGTNCIAFIHAQASNASGSTTLTEFNEYGYLFNLQGLTSGSTDLLYENTLKCAIGSTKWYLLMSTAQGSFTTSRPIVTTSATTAITIGACVTGVKITNASTYAIQIITNGRFIMGTMDIGIPVATTKLNAMEVHTEPAADLTADSTGITCGIRSRYHISTAQSSQISVIALEGRLRVKAALGDGCHAGVSGTIEAGKNTDAIAFTGTSTTQRSAGNFCVELSAQSTLAGSGWLCGVTIDSSVHGSVDVSSACTFAGLRIKTSSGKEPWTHGIYMGDDDAVTGITLGTCTTGIALSGVYTNGITIVNAAALVSGRTGIYVNDSFTLTTSGVHKAGLFKTTYNPATSGFATSIGVVGQVVLTAGKEFTGGQGAMYGVQGQLDLPSTCDVDDATSVFAGLRGVITGAPTITNFSVIAGIYVDNLATGSLSGGQFGSCLAAFTNHGAAIDHCIMVYATNAGSTVTNLLSIQGDSQSIVSAGAVGTTGAAKIRVLWGSTTYYINMYQS